MSQQDRDLEDLIRLMYSTLDYARLGMEVSAYNNCNTCGIIKACKFAPEYGKAVRWNCPLWTNRKE